MYNRDRNRWCARKRDEHWNSTGGNEIEKTTKNILNIKSTDFDLKIKFYEDAILVGLFP